jgi:hypothetical protein
MHSRIIPPLMLLLSLSFSSPISKFLFPPFSLHQITNPMVLDGENGIRKPRNPDFPTGYGYNINIDAPQTGALSSSKNKRYKGGEVNGLGPEGDAGVGSDVDGGHFGTWGKRAVDNIEVVARRGVEGEYVEAEPVSSVDTVAARPTYDGGN